MQKRKERVMKQARATWTNTAMQRLTVCDLCTCDVMPMLAANKLT